MWDLPSPGIEPVSPALAGGCFFFFFWQVDSLPLSHQGSPAAPWILFRLILKGKRVLKNFVITMKTHSLQLTSVLCFICFIFESCLSYLFFVCFSGSIIAFFFFFFCLLWVSRASVTLSIPWDPSPQPLAKSSLVSLPGVPDSLHSFRLSSWDSPGLLFWLGHTVSECHIFLSFSEPAEACYQVTS